MGFFKRLIKAPFEIVKDVIEDVEEIITGDEENE